MPQYKVKPGQKGFFAGKLYEAGGKRSILVTDKKLPNVPSWLEPMKGESKSARAQAEAEKAAEKAKADSEAAKEAQKKASQAKAKADAEAAKESESPKEKAPIDPATEEASVTFTESPKSTPVETL